jgi:hypothetical protein
MGDKGDEAEWVVVIASVRMAASRPRGEGGGGVAVPSSARRELDVPATLGGWGRGLGDGGGTARRGFCADVRATGCCRDRSPERAKRT